jgi:large subunit ribosomal protein L33
VVTQTRQIEQETGDKRQFQNTRHEKLTHFEFGRASQLICKIAPIEPYMARLGLVQFAAQNNLNLWALRGFPMAKKTGKSKKKLEVVHLVCEETGDYNYTIRKKGGGEKLKLKKFSPRLRKHTVHNEKKK